MERLLFAGNVALATTPATLAAVNATGIAEGAVALYDHEGAIISKALTKNIPYLLVVEHLLIRASMPILYLILILDVSLMLRVSILPELNSVRKLLFLPP